MDENPLAAQATPHGPAPTQRAVLTPYRSLGPNGFLMLMVGFGGVCFVTGMVFALMGAWPVTGFFGLDVLILYIAFRRNYRAARLHETIELAPEALTVTRVHPSGRSEAFAFNPYWVRVEFVEGHDGRTTLSLRHHDRRLAFGQFLNDEERRAVARWLSDALHTARGGGRI